MTQGLLPKFTTSAPTISPNRIPTVSFQPSQPQPTIEPTSPEDVLLPDLNDLNDLVEDLVEEYIEVEENFTDDYVDVLGRNENSTDEEYDDDEEDSISVSIGGGKLEKFSDRNRFLRKGD